MSAEDIKYVQKVTSKRARPNTKTSDDDIPIGVQYPNANGNAKRLSQAQPKKPPVDWFDFFLNAGCAMDDCTRYGSSFEREKIDATILLDLTEGTLRSLGLREGDIIRVLKAIAQRKPQESKDDQLKKDEELAKELQAELNGSASKPAPNLFAQGPGGALKAPRRGRPNPSKSLPPSVDLNSLTGGVRTSSPSLLSPVQAPPRSSSASGFDDDAWTNRPSSTKPVRAPSAPPTAPATVEPTPAAPAAAPPAPAQTSAPATASSSPTNLANTTESDIFNQLARLSELRKNAPSAPPAISTPPAQVASPASFRAGLGMGSSPAPLGQLQQQLQSQPTGMPPQQQQYSGPRGPFAPVPSNQGLLQPLIPTQTGFNSFVPTRPSNNISPFANPPSFLNSQPTGFQPSLMAQPTGFPGMQQQPMMSQPTGFPGMQMQQQPVMSQPTGMPFGGMNGWMGLMSRMSIIFLFGIFLISHRAYGYAEQQLWQFWSSTSSATITV